VHPTTEAKSPVHHVFVDFENVPAIDLDAISGQPVEVILLLGKSQKRLELQLVQQIHQAASQVRLIEMNASGKNALDFALAFHMGRAVAGCPASDFYHIISRDKDFDPLLFHLRHGGIQVIRHDSFSLPAVLAAGKPAGVAGGRPAVRPAVRPVAAAADIVSIVANRLRKSAANRPKRKSTLLSLINAQFRGQIREGEAAGIVELLAGRGIITIDAKDKVSYPGL
jgi:hypothetical protein